MSGVSLVFLANLEEIVSFGEWVQVGRNQLRYTRRRFADLVGCAPITIKRIERDERRPSVEIAELLATHLQIPETERKDFLRRARGGICPTHDLPYGDVISRGTSPCCGRRYP